MILFDDMIEMLGLAHSGVTDITSPPDSKVLTMAASPYNSSVLSL
jgi:hypothetical protein